MSALMLVGYAWIGFQLLHPAMHHDGFDFCLFKNLTGVPCPSCGITRSILQLFNGEWTSSILINPLGILAGLIMLIVPVWIVFDISRGTQSMAAAYRAIERFVQKQIVYIPLIALLLLNWYWNIEKGL